MNAIAEATRLLEAQRIAIYNVRYEDIPKDKLPMAIKLAAAHWMAIYEATEKGFYRIPAALRRSNIATAYRKMLAAEMIGVEFRLKE